MLLGYQTNSLQNHRLGDAARLLASHGYQAIAITPDTCHLDPASTSDRELDQVAALLRELGLQVVMETGARFVLDPSQKHEPTLMTREPSARAVRFEYLRRTAAMGARLGAKVLSFWAGIDRSPGGDSWSWLLDGVRQAGAIARAEGLVPAFEPEPGMAIETVADWRRLRADLGQEAPELTLDIGHLYAVWEGDPVAVIAAVAPFLRQVHLEDMRRGEHEHRLPGTGDVDFAGVLTALRKARYEGPVCFELSRSSHQAPAAVASCRSLWDQHVGPPRR